MFGPLLISCNVVFYVMPRSPRTLCGLLRADQYAKSDGPALRLFVCLRACVWEREGECCRNSGLLFFFFLAVFALFTISGGV